MGQMNIDFGSPSDVKKYRVFLIRENEPEESFLWIANGMGISIGYQPGNNNTVDIYCELTEEDINKFNEAGYGLNEVG